MAISLATYFCYPLFLSLAGDKDPSGGPAGMIAASFYLGGFAGPIVGGLLLMWVDSFAILALAVAIAFGPIVG